MRKLDVKAKSQEMKLKITINKEFRLNALKSK